MTIMMMAMMKPRIIAGSDHDDLVIRTLAMNPLMVMNMPMIMMTNQKMALMTMTAMVMVMVVVAALILMIAD